ncbi:MAG: FIST C-terminal domain-containing protein [Clostridiales Family XIII bacterium]|jgi:hypothetical protein|nr:FIST C-terminal domain-containing protein [Clostridiales Family XIII bacterium]
MIKMYSAFTEEADDAAAAISELEGALAGGGGLLAHSIGLVHCHQDFVTSGVLRAISEQFAFPVVGITTNSAANDAGYSAFGLGLQVLTSDDVRFEAGITGSVKGNPREALAPLVGRICGGGGEPAKFLLAYAPLIIGQSGDSIVKAITELSGGLPVFGSLPISDEADFADSAVLYEGEAYLEAAALIGFFGEIDPVFFTIDVKDENILKTDALITRAEDNILYCINGMPTAQYTESINLAAAGGLESLLSTPFVLDCPDGARLVRSCFSNGPCGSAVLGGDACTGAKVGFAVTEPKDIVETAAVAAERALLSKGGRGAVFMYSCAGRIWSLGMDDMAEIEKVRSLLLGQMPFFLAYSGGELYPQLAGDGAVINTMQNHSLVVCVL